MVTSAAISQSIGYTPYTGSGSTTVVVQPPPAYSSGDLLLMTAMGAGTAVVHPATPSGWTAISAANAPLGVFTKTASASESAYTVTFSGTCQGEVSVIAYPAASVSTSGLYTSSTAVTTFTPSVPAGITSGEQVVLCCGAVDSGNGGNATPNNHNLNLPSAWAWTQQSFGANNQPIASGLSSCIGVAEYTGNPSAPTVTSTSGSTFYTFYVVLTIPVLAAPLDITVTCSGPTTQAWGSAGGRVFQDAAQPGMAVTVVALTGTQTVAEIVANAGVASQSAAGTPVAPAYPITPKSTGSKVYGGLWAYQTTAAFTAESNTSFYENINDTLNSGTPSYGTFAYTGTTTASSSVTLGASAPSNGYNTFAAAEILSAGTISQTAVATVGATKITDYTTPTVTQTVTFAQRPVAGSLLVAIVACNANPTVAENAVLATVSDTLNLNWTQLVHTNFYAHVSVWVAEIAGGPGYILNDDFNGGTWLDANGVTHSGSSGIINTLPSSAIWTVQNVTNSAGMSAFGGGSQMQYLANTTLIYQDGASNLVIAMGSKGTEGAAAGFWPAGACATENGGNTTVFGGGVPKYGITTGQSCEFRVKINPLAGCWPACWFESSVGSYGTGTYAEIDMQESGDDGSGTTTAQAGETTETIWGGANGTQYRWSRSTPSFNMSDGNYHTYRLDLTENLMQIFIDGVLNYSLSAAQGAANWSASGNPSPAPAWPFNANNGPWYAILNVATNSGVSGNPAAGSLPHISMLVDYVRMWAPAGPDPNTNVVSQGAHGAIALKPIAFAASSGAAPVTATGSMAMGARALAGLAVQGAKSTGSVAMAARAMLAYQVNPPAQQALMPGPTWLAFYKPGQRPLRITQMPQFLSVGGSLALSEAPVSINASATSAISLFPQDPLNLVFEILVNGTWNDITQFVYQRANVVITRGTADETQSMQPSQMTLTLDNRDGRFSPDNTSGAYYPYLGRNTQVRCSIVNQSLVVPALPVVESYSDVYTDSYLDTFGVDEGPVDQPGGYNDVYQDPYGPDGELSQPASSYTGYRFWGEASEWPPQSDPSQADIYVELTVSGVSRRYQQGATIGSALRRYYSTLPAAEQPYAIWPCEDGSAATSLSSALPAPVPLNSNPYFLQEQAVGWTAIAGSFAVTGSPPSSAPYPFAGQYVNDGTGAGGMAQSQLPFTASGSSYYSISATVYSSSTTVQAGFDWLDASGNYLTTTTHNFTVSASTWTTISVQLLSNASTAAAYPRIGTSSGNSATVYAEGIVVLPAGTLAGFPMAVAGAPQFASNSAFGGSDPIPVISSSTWHGITNAAADPPGTGSLTENSPGTYIWVCPPGVSTVTVGAWGGGGGGGWTGNDAGGGGGGGGEYSSQSIAVTPGVSYTYVVPAGGAASGQLTSGSPGGNATFTGDSATVTAHGGSGGGTGNEGAGGPGGGGSSNSTHYTGGSGGTGEISGQVTFTQTLTGKTGASGNDLPGTAGSTTTTWICPAGTTAVGVGCVGSGGGGGGSGTVNYGGVGGGGGAYAAGQVNVTPGTSYVVSAGNGGHGGKSSTLASVQGQDGVESSFTGDAGSLVAASGGQRGGYAGGLGAGGSGITGTGNAGGAGGVGAASTASYGGGGGGGGNRAFAGNAGGNGAKAIGRAPGAGNGAGGSGGWGDIRPGGGGQTAGQAGNQTGAAGGGGGGAGSVKTGNDAAGGGGPGQVTWSWTNMAATGGGGGSSAGTHGAGSPGGNNGSGAVAPQGGGAGGAMDVAGTIPGGGGGGMDPAGSAPGAGAAGQVTLNWSGGGTSPVAADVVRFLLDTAVAGLVDGTVVARIVSYSTATTMDVVYHTASGGSLTLVGYTGVSNYWTSGSLILSPGLNGTPYLIDVELTESGANANWALNAVEAAAGTVTGISGTVDGVTVGYVSDVFIAPNGDITDSTTAAGWITVQTYADPLATVAQVLTGYAGELAADRFLRLCGEEGISGVLIGSNTDTPQCGPQPDLGIMDVFQTIQDLDRGQLFEPRDSLGLGYRTRINMQGNSPDFTADYAQGELSPPFVPVLDDQYSRNDITVTRTNGGSVRAYLPTGPLSIMAPPNGIGEYTYALTVSAFEDFQLANLAAWMLSVGTVSDYRYPTITLQLERPELALAVAVIAALDIGDFVEILNPPSWATGAPVQQLCWGFTETLNAFVWDIQVNMVPESPYGEGSPPVW